MRGVRKIAYIPEPDADSPVYDYFLNFLVEKATPREILAFVIPDIENKRAFALLEKRDMGTLTAEEAVELDQMQHVDRLISVLKARALAASKHS